MPVGHIFLWRIEHVPKDQDVALAIGRYGCSIDARHGRNLLDRFKTPAAVDTTCVAARKGLSRSSHEQLPAFAGSIRPRPVPVFPNVHDHTIVRP